ncbi:hypothetical protein [Flavobacterium sp.]|uniref:hypothetical protein n=1 Tax=Flavobacterium sp. TaxID=239 RepID=UPI0035289127
MNNTAFCSVIFPGNLIYLDDFLCSLENQTDTSFDLLLFNDGVKELENYLINRKLSFKIINAIGGTIGEVRTFLFSYLKQSEYKLFIFGDTDDYFSANRVEDCKKKLDEVDILANDLILVNNEKNEISGPYWVNRPELKNTISLNSIKKYNFLGLGNTAIRKEIIPENIHFEPQLIAIDWYFYSIVLKNNWKVRFSFDSFTYYRQHNTNIIGRKKLSFEEYVKGFNIKLNHYISLAKESHDFADLALQYKEFKDKISEDSYKEKTERINIQNPFWWEEIQL